MAKITQNRQVALFPLRSFNQSQAGKRKKKGCRNICLMNRKICDSQSIIKSTNISYIWIREIIHMVVFYFMFESIQISGFVKKFWISVRNSRSNIIQTLLSGTGF